MYRLYVRIDLKLINSERTDRSTGREAILQMFAILYMYLYFLNKRNIFVYLYDWVWKEEKKRLKALPGFN